MAAVQQQAEDWARLPGVEAFCGQFKRRALNAFQQRGQNWLDAWNVIRACYEYGERPDVQAAVAAMNVQADGKKKVGRPHTGHRLAIEAIADATMIPLRTLAFWQRAWNKVWPRLGLAAGCTEDRIKCSLPKTPDELALQVDELLSAGDDDDEADAEPLLPFKDLANIFARRLDGLLLRAGEPALRSKRNQELLADKLTDWFARHGVRAEIAFKA